MDVPPEVNMKLWQFSLTAKGRAALWLIISLSLIAPVFAVAFVGYYISIMWR
ncbi:hypothetical protein [Rhodoplanes sp.]|uniref:hypothetical protein n=1 Tax=Rhodoplanes sp. TaxID=1968906 RepID=UPI0025DF61CB|nr:hypothetical protein [Rhodoplanes sp.]